MEAPHDFYFDKANAPRNQNGRVNLNPQSSAGGFLGNYDAGFQYRTQAEANASESLLRGNWAENTLSKTFFSPDNIKIIQNAIRFQVYQRSGDKQWIIDEQSIDELQIVMRSIYLQYAKNLETDIPGQISDLNDLVVEWIVPRVLSEVSMYYYYLEDISHLPIPLSHPVAITGAGTKSLPFRKFM
jgi:hypothetical protein